MDKKTLIDTDFDALLLEAKRKHDEIVGNINEHAYDADSSATDALRKEWHEWVDANLTKKGLQMTVEPVSGRPTSLFVVLAGNF